MASKRALRALRSIGAHAEAPAQRNGLRQATIQQQQTRSQSSSTSAIAYKALHRRISPLPAAPITSSVSPAAAVSSILYETPLPSQAPPNRHVLNCLVQNEPGVLSRVSGILAARGFNIDSLVVCSTEVADLSRMTIVLQGQDGVVEQARRQLEDLVPVWAVLDYTAAPLVQRELLLAKISILGPEYFEELLTHHREMTDADGMVSSTDDMSPEQLQQMGGQAGHEISDYHPRNLAPSEALRLKNQHLETITHLTHQFGGKVLDISTNNCIVEVSAKPTRIDSFMKLIAPFGILESARTGEFARERGLRWYCVCCLLTIWMQVSWLFLDHHCTTRARSRRRWRMRLWITALCRLASCPGLTCKSSVHGVPPGGLASWAFKRSSRSYFVGIPQAANGAASQSTDHVISCSSSSSSRAVRAESSPVYALLVHNVLRLRDLALVDDKPLECTQHGPEPILRLLEDQTSRRVEHLIAHFLRMPGQTVHELPPLLRSSRLRQLLRHLKSLKGLQPLDLLLFLTHRDPRIRDNDVCILDRFLGALGLSEERLRATGGDDIAHEARDLVASRCRDADLDTKLLCTNREIEEHIIRIPHPCDLHPLQSKTLPRRSLVRRKRFMNREEVRNRLQRVI